MPAYLTGCVIDNLGCPATLTGMVAREIQQLPIKCYNFGITQGATRRMHLLARDIASDQQWRDTGGSFARRPARSI